MQPARRDGRHDPGARARRVGQVLAPETLVADPLGLDTETFLITPRCLAPRLVCVTWADVGTLAAADRGIFRHDDPDLIEWLRAALARGVVLHNAPYDMAVLIAAFPELLPDVFDALDAGRVEDTMTREKLLDIAQGEFRWRRGERVNYHLIDLVRHYFKRDMIGKDGDGWRLRYSELYDVLLADWPEDATAYAITDAVEARAVRAAQEKRRWHGDVDLLVDQERQVRAAMWLHLAGCWGMRIHPDKVERLAAGIQAEWDELRDGLMSEGLLRTQKHRVGPPTVHRNTKAAKVRMLAAHEENGGGKLTAKGEPCLDEEACGDSGDPVLADYARFSALSNVLGKDIPHLSTGEIHPSFDPLMGSGRTSSRGFNLQNMRVKGGTRECFVPREDHVYAIIDLTAAELYAVAQLCISYFGQSKLAEVLNARKDPHVMLAANMLERDYDEVLAEYEAGDETIAAERKLGKHANYGLWGGMCETRFGQLIKRLVGRVLEPEHLYFIRETWLRTWPEAGAYLDMFKRACRGGTLTAVEQFGSGRWRGGLRYSEAANTGFQGLIADLMKAAGWELCREMYDARVDSVLLGSRIVNFPHDEFICEVPEAIAAECAARISEIVLGVGALWTPDVPVIGEVYLAKYWSKSAFALHDENGMLIPWDGQKKGG
jgi:DNA polymerase family A